MANEGGPVRKPKPPVSPKPVVAQIKRQGGPQTPPQPVSNKRVPLPGPGTPGSPGKHSGFGCFVYILIPNALQEVEAKKQ